MTQERQTASVNEASPEEVSAIIGDPLNEYHAALKSLVERVNESVPHPYEDPAGQDPAPENTVAPETIADDLQTRVAYVERSLMRVFVCRGIVYRTFGDEYVLLPQSTHRVSQVLTHTNTFELGYMERAFIRAEEALGVPLK